MGFFITRYKGFGGTFKTVVLFLILKSLGRGSGDTSLKKMSHFVLFFTKIRSQLSIKNTPRNLKDQTALFFKGGRGRGCFSIINVFPPFQSCMLWRCINKIVRLSCISQFRTETCHWVILGREPEIPRADDTQRARPDSATSQQVSQAHLRSTNPSNTGTWGL